MQYTPKGNKQNAITVATALIFSALVLIVFSLNKKGISYDCLRAVALSLVLTFALITPRFLLSSFTYIFDDFEFVVEHRCGKKIKTVCRLYYTDITSVSPKKQAKNKEKGSIHQNYCVTMFAKERIYLSYDMDTEKGTVVLEGDKALENLINRYTSSETLDS